MESKKAWPRELRLRGLEVAVVTVVVGRCPIAADCSSSCCRFCHPFVTWLHPFLCSVDLSSWRLVLSWSLFSISLYLSPHKGVPVHWLLIFCC
mmetsp:Transcript_79034/g.164153  ORF Transcript_79034/g.164153 Transcript_79034/m.164153 type:complete len:93 (-) Transcript_79034:216-494(-)